MPKIRLYAMVALPLIGLAACSSGSSDTDVSPDPQVAAAPAARDTAKVGVAAGVTQAPPAAADTAAVAVKDTTAAVKDTVAGYQASGAAGMTHTLNLTAVNNSGFTGTAVLTDLGGGKTKVALTLGGPATADASVDHDAHFHSGTCAAPGPIVHELKDVRANGQPAESEIAASTSALADGNLVVQVHGDNSPNPIACAEVKKAM